MSRRRIAKLESQLATGRGRRRRRAVEELAENLSPQGVELLAREFLRDSGDLRVRERAREALEGLRSQREIDVVCGLWARERSPELGDLVVLRRWVAGAPPEVRTLSALKAGRPDVLAYDGAEVVDTLAAALSDADPAIAKAAHDGLRALRSPVAVQALARAALTMDESVRRAVRVAVGALDASTVNAVCQLWARNRDRALGALIGQLGWVATAPLDVRALTAVHSGRPEALAADGPAVVPLLLKLAEGRTGDPLVAHARQALSMLRDPAAQESLCRVVIETDDPVAADAARSGSFAPAEAGDRALFLFLTHQWERYEDLDFDQSLLRAAYAVADAPLRERLAACARAGGRREWVAVVAGARRGRRLAEMTEREWETAMAVLDRSRRWDELWRLAQDSSARWAARVISRLNDVAWAPENADERAAFISLLPWARACAGSPPAHLLARRGEALQKFSRGVRAVACSADGAALAVAMPGGGVQTWGVAKRSQRARLEGSVGGEGSLHFVEGAVLAGAGHDGVIRTWPLDQAPCRPRPLGRHTGAAHAVAAADGRTLVSGGADKLIRRWDLEDSTRRALWRGHSGNVSSLAVVEQAGLLASGGRDGVRLWSLRNGLARPVPAGLDGPVVTIARVSQLQLAVLGRDGRVKLWSLPDGTVRTLGVERISALAGVPDRGTTLLGTSHGRLLVLTSPDATEPVGLGATHEGQITAIGASDSGDVIASAGADGQVLLWEPEVYRWDRLPLGEASRADLERLEDVLAGPTTSQERPWLHLAAGLLRLRRRFDIEVSQPAIIEVGAFDIEIEG